VNIIIINESSTLTVESLEYLETILHEVDAVFMESHPYENSDVFGECDLQEKFTIEPCKFDDNYYMIKEPVLWDLCERNNKTYKNNLPAKVSLIRRQNTSHSGWAGRKLKKKRSGK